MTYEKDVYYDHHPEPIRDVCRLMLELYKWLHLQGKPKERCVIPSLKCRDALIEALYQAYVSEDLTQNESRFWWTPRRNVRFAIGLELRREIPKKYTPKRGGRTQYFWKGTDIRFYDVDGGHNRIRALPSKTHNKTVPAIFSRDNDPEPL